MPVRVLSRLFRRLFLKLMQKAFDSGKVHFFSSLEALQDRKAFLRYLAPVRKAEWVVYAKAPFAGPQQVLDYVGRYTHRVAISNHRLLNMENGQVRFRWKDYRDNNRQETMTLKADEFIRRFLLHVLPNGFQRIGYYGFLGNRYRSRRWNAADGYCACRTTTRRVPNRRAITAIAVKISPARLYGNARSVTRAACT